MLEVGLIVDGVSIGYIVGRLRTQAKYDKTLFRRGLKRNG